MGKRPYKNIQNFLLKMVLTVKNPFRLLATFLPTSLLTSSLLAAPPTIPEKVCAAAIERTTHTVIYNPLYQKIDYPNGDVSMLFGVCTDVVIRAYRKALGIDLQQLVHEDMKANFGKYPSKRLWGLTRTDTNIDHRRVPNLRVFFERQGASLPISEKAEDYKPGDLVTWELNPTGRSTPHIGIVVNNRSQCGKRPLIVHNIGSGPQTEDVLFKYKITGHYRWLPSP
jgi:uncharacterized protein